MTASGAGTGAATETGTADAVALRGRVLRAWREHAGVSAAALARSLPVQRSAVSMWEGVGRAKRSTTADMVWSIAARLGLTEAQAATMSDLWRAAASVTDGLPRQRWSINVDGPSGPAWAWLRPDCAGGPSGGRLRAALWWGAPFQTAVDVDVPPGGIVVTLPTTLPNPALEVTLDRPGWVDVGRGSIPDDVAAHLGMGVVDGAALLRPSGSEPLTGRGAASRTLTETLLPAPYIRALRMVFEELGIGWRVLRPHAALVEGSRITAPTVGTPRHQPEPDSGALTPRLEAPSTLVVTPDRLYRIRQARGWSRQALAGEVTRLDPANPVSAKAVEAIEANGRIPQITGFLARLDRVLGLDGRSGTECTFDSRADPCAARSGQYRVPFPGYWVGPVWLLVLGPTAGPIAGSTGASTGGPTPCATGPLDLRWGPWRRRQVVKVGEVLGFRRSPTAGPVLEVSLPAHWQVIAGVGAWPSALDINRDWWPADMRSALGLLRDALEQIRAGHLRSTGG